MPHVMERFEEGKRGSLDPEISRTFRKDFFGPQAVRKTFGTEFKSSEVPPIPFNLETLKRAKENGFFLILRAEKGVDGKALTMKNMRELYQEDFRIMNRGEIIKQGSGWFENEEWFFRQTPRPAWSLVSKNIIKGPVGEDYLEQTQRLVNYLKNKIFGNIVMPKKLSEALSEFERQKDSLQSDLRKDPAGSARKLTSLGINRIIRQSPSEALFDIMTNYFNKDGNRLIQDSLWVWTNGLTSNDHIISHGQFFRDGVAMHGWEPQHRDSLIGVRPTLTL